MIVLLLMFASYLEISDGNIALHRPVYISTLFHHENNYYHPEGVVDGNNVATLSSFSCFSTDHDDMSPFWMVDLLNVYVIDNITITNTNNHLSERFHDFKIEVFITNPVRCPWAVGQLCLQYDGDFGLVQTVTCLSEVKGRFLRIQKFQMDDSHDTLIICEVDIRGSKDNSQENWQRYPRTPNVRFDQTSSPSRRANGLSECASRCFFDGSCMGFNYGRNDGQCQLVTGPSSSDERMSDQNVDYYRHDLC